MDFISQAYNYKHDWWRYLLAIALSVALSLVLPALFAVLVVVVCGVADNVDFAAALFHAIGSGTLPAWQECIFLLSGHCFFILSLLFAFRKIHKGRTICLISSFTKIRWSRIGVGIIIYMLFSLLAELLMFDKEVVEYVFDAKEFFPYLAVLLLMLPIQVTAEEIFNRSYLGQMFAVMFKYPIVSVLLTSAIFAPLHYGDMQSTESYGVLFADIFVIGITYAIIMVLDDGIELCIGMHYINNLIGLILIKHDGLSGIFRYSEGFKIGYSQVLLDLLIYTIVLLIFTKIYHWDWRRLFKKIEKPEMEMGQKILSD